MKGKNLLFAFLALVVSALLPEIASAAGVLGGVDYAGSFTDIRADIVTLGGGVILVALTIYGIRSVKSTAK
jgi:hypothetical protein